MVKHLIRWKTKHWIHVRWQIHSVQLSYIVNTWGMLSTLFQKWREEKSEKRIVEHSLIDKVLRKSTIIATC